MKVNRKRVIGTRPEDVPAGWPIFNAPRPLVGTMAWNGDFIHGRFYVAVDLSDAIYAKTMIKRNIELDAWLIEYITEEEASQSVIDYYSSKYDAADFEDVTEEQVLEAFGSINKLVEVEI